MLPLVIPEREYFDDSKQEFVKVKAQTLTLEHSLLSISKWESEWKKPFLSKETRTYEETISYIKCMTLNSGVSDRVYRSLTVKDRNKVLDYIEDKMTATWFNDPPGGRKGGRGQVVTSELVYYWMIEYGIPFECQKWHFNRLLTLIRICEIKSGPSKKMPMRELFASNRALNEARRKALGSKG